MTTAKVLYQYQIITHSNPTLVENVVSLFIGEGWKCQGGISIAHNPDEPDKEKRILYSQALIRG